jgi:hypothetical protein
MGRHVARTVEKEKKKAHMLLEGKSEGKRSLGRPRRKLVENRK